MARYWSNRDEYDTYSQAQHYDDRVIWDPDIVTKVKPCPPMEYSGHERVANDDVTILDIQRFFVQYAVSNNLGVIAHAHLALSDQLEDGPHHGKCIRLAQLHSDAVDFPKSGIPAVMKPELKPKKYPDFMEKTTNKSYPSKRVLGKIFRDCGKPLVFSPKDCSKSFNRLLLIDGFQKYMEDARRCKAEYDDEMRSLMNQYGVKRLVHPLATKLCNFLFLPRFTYAMLTKFYDFYLIRLAIWRW